MEVFRGERKTKWDSLYTTLNGWPRNIDGEKEKRGTECLIFFVTEL
jgi:hypothetical protein